MMLYPTPSTQGLAKLKNFYLNEWAMTLSDEQAYEILSGLMRFLYLTQIKPAREQAIENPLTRMTTTQTHNVKDRALHPLRPKKRE